uniref:Polyprotein n=1 Tax=Cajanus cajan TaxID=3821 RepID=A0A151QXR4_CAJCA|nr:polyprotein [Cajanus cajan]
MDVFSTHPGMSPSDLKLARQECQELLRQGLIEHTESNWTCQAFYVEKRSERLRGKKRLVIDYKPAVFIEEMEGKKFYCGHARHHFEVQMDNSSFPKILDFKNKLPPEPQILRLKDWFSMYDFTVKYIKGKNNLITDFLSRPQKPVFVISSSHSFPLIFMVKPLSDTAKTRKLYPPSLEPKSPEEIIQFAKAHYFYYLHETLRFKIVPPSMFDPTEDHSGIFELFCEIGWDLSEPTLWAIWCKTVQNPIPIALRTQSTYDILINPDKDDYLFWTLKIKTHRIQSTIQHKRSRKYKT